MCKQYYAYRKKKPTKILWVRVQVLTSSPCWKMVHKSYIIYILIYYIRYLTGSIIIILCGRCSLVLGKKEKKTLSLAGQSKKERFHRAYIISRGKNERGKTRDFWNPVTVWIIYHDKSRSARFFVWFIVYFTLLKESHFLTSRVVWGTRFILRMGNNIK